MAEFLPAYEQMIRDEGGYKLTNIKGDAGGVTYAGIARNMNPSWAGWEYIDRGATPPSELVRSFYRDGYWVPIKGDLIVSQSVAACVFNFAVNTSAYGNPKVAVKLLQSVVGATPDGVFGPRTLEAVNQCDERLFLSQFTLAKIARYAAICNKNRQQTKFLLGWVNRALKGAKV